MFYILKRNLSLAQYDVKITLIKKKETNLWKDEKVIKFQTASSRKRKSKLGLIKTKKNGNKHFFYHYLTITQKNCNKKFVALLQLSKLATHRIFVTNAY